MKSTCPTPAPRVGDLTPPIFHLLALGVGVGGNANFSVHVGGNANFSVFRYKHAGIPNVKLWCWGSKPMRGPNVNGFASQWNIGFMVTLIRGSEFNFHLDCLADLLTAAAFRNLSLIRDGYKKGKSRVLNMLCSRGSSRVGNRLRLPPL